ncbi:MAG TPA: 30S ribosomal protein S6 [Thermoleophilaceae bacterium]
MPLYDLMLLLDPGAPSDRQESILKDVQGLLESGGKLVGSYDWGTRRMTFEIDHRPEAAYHLFQFETEGGGALLERVDHSLKIMDGVLRHRIIRLKDGSPPPPMPSPDRRYGDYEAEAAPPAAAAPVATDAPAEAAPGADVPAADVAAADVAGPDAPAEAAPAEAPADAAPAEAAPAEAPSDAEAPAAAPEAPATDAETPAAAPDAGPGDDEAPSGPAAA